MLIVGLTMKFFQTLGFKEMDQSLSRKIPVKKYQILCSSFEFQINNSINHRMKIVVWLRAYMKSRQSNLEIWMPRKQDAIEVNFKNNNWIIPISTDLLIFYPIELCNFHQKHILNMNYLLQLYLTGTASQIKQEVDSCCSPSPTSSNNNVSILSFGSTGQEPVS